MIEKSLKIFDHIWHIPHQYTLATSFREHQFYMYSSTRRQWVYESRPKPDNVTFVPFYERGKYDLAIAHVDGQAVDPNDAKGETPREILEMADDTTRVVINHGTPYIPERLHERLQHIEDEDKRIEAARQITIGNMNETIPQDVPMVVNSKQAKKEWTRGWPIVHGMYGNPEEEYYSEMPKEPRVMFMASLAGWDYYYNRRLMADIKAGLNEEGIGHIHIRADFKPRSFDEYREYIGKTLISVHTYRQSPMPRSRTEHMLSGGCVVTTPHHDVGDMFTGLEFTRDADGKLEPKNENDAEIVFIDERTERPSDMVEKIVWLYDNPDVAERIGQNGRDAARHIFSMNNYRMQWEELLEHIL